MAVCTYMLSGCAVLALLLVILAITAYSIPLGGYTWKVFQRLEENSWSISAEEVWTLNSSFVEYDGLKSFEFWLVSVAIVIGIVVLACLLCALFGMIVEGLVCFPCKMIACGFGRRRRRGSRRRVQLEDEDEDDESDEESVGYDNEL